MKTITTLAAALAAWGGSAMAAPRAIEGGFGRVELDPERPALAALTLRRADGSLEPQSLLSPKGASWQRGMPDWGTQDGLQFVEAAGARAAADGQWHHTAAVYDRTAQTLALFLDGKPDGTPPSIAGIGASSSPSPLTLGAFSADGAFAFDGELDEVSIQRAALPPEGLSFDADYPAAAALKLGAQAGRYTTAPCDWGQPVRLTALGTAATLNDGTLAVQIETSNDGFRTIAATPRLVLGNGAQTAPLAGLAPVRQARLVFSLVTPGSAERSPILAAAELTAEPAGP